MPLGKYYCDYCKKQFQDTPFARKRHLQGLQHLRAKALWFDSLTLNDTSQPHHPDGFSKGFCNRFLKTGFCPYGDSCKYFHPKNNTSSHNTLQGVAAPGLIDNGQSSQVVSTMQVFGGGGSLPAPGLGNVQSSPVGSRIQLFGGSSLPSDVMRDSMGMSWGNLPPSLKPPPESGYPPLPFVDWG